MTEVSSLSVTSPLDSHHMKGLDVLLEDQEKCPMTQREVERSISIRGHGWRITSRGGIKLEAK